MRFLSAPNATKFHAIRKEFSADAPYLNPHVSVYTPNNRHVALSVSKYCENLGENKS